MSYILQSWSLLFFQKEMDNGPSIEFSAVYKRNVYIGMIYLCCNVRNIFHDSLRHLGFSLLICIFSY
jgi:hypothetical protein